MQAQEIQLRGREFATQLASLVEVIRRAIHSFEQQPVAGMELAYKKWKRTALELLASDLQTTQVALSDTTVPSNQQLLLKAAQNELGLAKNLDSFRFDFAGEDYVKLLEENIESTVSKASALIQALSHA